MSQPIQQQQGRTYFQEQEHVPGAHSGQGIGDGGLLCVFQSLVMNGSSTTLRHCRSTGPSQLGIVSCLNTGTAIPLIPATPLISLTAHFPLSSHRTQKERIKSLATIQAVVLQNLQPKSSPPYPISPGADGAEHPTTLGLTQRGEWKPVPTCFLALEQMKLKQFEITLPCSASNAAKHSL